MTFVGGLGVGGGLVAGVVVLLVILLLGLLSLVGIKAPVGRCSNQFITNFGI